MSKDKEKNLEDILSLKDISKNLDKSNNDLGVNISRIEKEISSINKCCKDIREKIGCSEEKDEDNIIGYITKVEKSNKEIVKILDSKYQKESFYNKHPYFNGEYYKTSEGKYSLGLYFLPAIIIIIFGIIMFMLPEGESKKSYISLYTVFLDKYYLVFCAIMIGFSFSRYYDLLVNHDFDDNLVKKSREYLLWIIFIFNTFYIGIGIIAYYIFTNYSQHI